MKDVNQILADLRKERQQIEEVIASLERLAARRGRQRGRPWLGNPRKGPDNPGGGPRPPAKAAMALRIPQPPLADAIATRRLVR